MPDAALRDTEQQFMSLLEAASDGLLIRPVFYSLPGIKRNESIQQRMDKTYISTEHLGAIPIDGLIVTGKEPVTADLRDETCWGAFTRLIDWARENTYSTIWSCLAAHAAVLHDDGIQRRRSAVKQFGVFRCERVEDHLLLAGTHEAVTSPHSRWNGLSEKELTMNGYSILTRSEEVGIDLFTKNAGSLFVYFQGHPEYADKTLLLEYRRDAGRFIKGDIDVYPNLPHNYFDFETALALTEISQQAPDFMHNNLLSAVSGLLEASIIPDTWGCDARQIYRNWLQYIVKQKAICDSTSIDTMNALPVESSTSDVAISPAALLTR
jgi:homoserine O-succinyltransferase